MGNKADMMVGFSCGPSDQDKDADEIFYKQVAEMSQSLALALMRDLHLLDI